MIKVEQIKELESIINYINNSKNFKKTEVKNNTDDVEYLLKVLSDVKASRIKKIVTSAKAKEYNQEEIISHYTKDEVMKIFADEDIDILEKYKMNDLKEMFCTFYEKKPMSNQKKEDIVTSIRSIINNIKRAQAFADMKM